MGVYTELSLFSGYGGFSLGLQLAGVRSRTVCYVEIDDYCQRIIQARIRDGHLDDAPIWDDVKTFDGRPWAGLVDIVTAGFPCQPHSVAGQRKGADDDRNLWPDTLRVVSEVRPRYVLLENAGIELRNGPSPAYAYSVLADLTSIGYDAEWASVPAAAVGAPHLRWRWWCLAYTDRRPAPTESVAESGCADQTKSSGHGQDWDVADADIERREDGQCSIGIPATHTNLGDGSETVADSDGCRRGTAERDLREGQPHASGCGSLADTIGDGGGTTRAHHLRPESSDVVRGGATVTDAPSEQVGAAGQSWPSARGAAWWAAEPSVGRVVDGCPNRVDELRALGNGIVPAVVARFLRGC